MQLKKTIILSSPVGEKKKAVLNLEKNAISNVGEVRLYNFDSEPSGILSLGIITNGKVIKLGLNKKSQMLYSFETSENITQDFSCVLVNIVNGKSNPILVSTAKGKQPNETELKLASAIGVLESLQIDEVRKELDKNQIFLEDEEELEKEITKAMEDNCGGNCATCKYREAFFTNEKPVAKQQSSSFYAEIKNQLSKLFEKYPEEEFLAQIIPNSKWVKVDYEDNGEYYVVGIIYENERIKYICYGVPGIWANEPPKELEGFSQWLPLDANKPESYGYWLTYQDSESGENLIIDVI